MGKIVIQDTADVTITDLVSGKVVLNAEAQLAGIQGSISEEDLQGGIGNKKLYKIRTDKAIDLSMRSAVADPEYWAMTQGVAVEQGGTMKVTSNFIGTVEEDSLAVNVIFLPLGTTASVGDKVRASMTDGTQEEFDVISATNTAIPAVTGLAVDLSTVVAPVALGDKLQVFYKEDITGQRISIDSTKFSNKYEVEMKTIAYDLETAKVTADIYFQFPETIPSGEFDISLENGSVYSPEINFSVLNPKGEDEMGAILIKSR